MSRAAVPVATLAACLLCAGGLFAAELPSRREAPREKQASPRSCEIEGETGVRLGDGCVHVGGYVSVGVGIPKPH